MRRLVVTGVVAAAIGFAHAAPPTPADLAALCANAEDQAQCGRLVEERQLKSLPGLAVRDGDDLRVSLYPSGTAVFRDAVRITGAQTYALWDALSAINGVVLFTTEGDRSGFLLLMRTNGRMYRLAAEPVLSPDRQYLVTADFCADGCDNELVLWRITRDEMMKERVLRPDAVWRDAVAQWRGPDRLVIEYKREGSAERVRVELTLADARWRSAR